MREYFVWLAKFVTLLCVLFVGVPLVLVLVIGAAVQIVSRSADTLVGDPAHKVAVVEVTGIILDARQVIEDLHQQVDDDSVKGIVLRIDSPGGAVGPSQEIFSAVRKLKHKKPIVASMGSVAASGGLYAALGASKILAQPGTLTGSIGVIMEIPNFTDVAQKIGVDMITIKSGKFKDAGNSFRKMSPEEVQFLESTVQLSHVDFIEAVAEGRKLSKEKVLTFADGRVLLGRQAKDLGLIDGFGDVYEAASEVFRLRGEELKEGDRPQLYYPGDKYRELRRILESFMNLPLLGRSSLRLQYLMQ